jgi:predicted secreted protein
MIKVRGKDVTLYVYRGGSPALAVCATNLSRRESVENLNITTIDSTRANEYVGGSTDSEVTLSGVRTLANSSDWQIDDFEIGNIERIIIIYLDSAGNSVSYDGNVLITGVEDENGAADFSTYSVTMLRSGAWTKLYDITIGGVHYLVDSNGDFILDSFGNRIITPV